MTFELKDVESTTQLRKLLETGRFRIQEERKITGYRAVKTGKKDRNGKDEYVQRPRISVKLALVCTPKGRPWYEWELYGIPAKLWADALKEDAFIAAFPEEKRKALTDPADPSKIGQSL